MSAKKRIWTALRWRNFRIYMAGQSISLVGTFMQTVGVSWLVYRLTNSEFSLGLFGFLTELASVAVVLFAGVLADRNAPQRMLLAAQTLAMLQAFALSLLVFTGHIDVAAVFALGCFLGMLNGMEAPARQALFPVVVADRNDLRSAVALYSLSLDAARMAGPALAGVVIASRGEGWCFLANGFSYLAVIIALISLRAEPRPCPAAGEDLVRSLATGIGYVSAHPFIRAIILLIVAVSFGGSAVAVLMPVMAAGVLKGGPETLGVLMASLSLGALAGAFLLGMKNGGEGELKILTGAGACLYGLAVAAFSHSSWLWLSVTLLMLAGLGIMVLMASANTFLLTEVEADKRGRVMSIFTLSFMGTVPFGSLCAGILAEHIGTPATIAAGAAICIIGALLFIGFTLRTEGV